ncbi:PspC domain-containing protein [Arthrobacter castelli]|uniref:PspC domain-containing protein n=1 Tax=Arthrobacter castelli TaxID=271431 RepID=UPI0003F4EF57|nr:PspC domain-containing protein [Arthrobacter castelli]
MDKFFKVIRGMNLKRGPERWVGGVCGGLAAKFRVDVAYVRIGFLLFGLLPGPAFVVYILAWLLLPAQNGRIPLQGMLENRGDNTR